MIKNFVQSKAYYVLSVLISIALIITSFSYEGYQFYSLFILATVNILLIIFNIKRGAFNGREKRN